MTVVERRMDAAPIVGIVSFESNLGADYSESLEKVEMTGNPGETEVEEGCRQVRH